MRGLDNKSKECCQISFNEGYNWYLNQQEADGSLGVPVTDTATFYNVFYCFALGGQWRAAKRFANWARKNIIDSDNTLKVDSEGIWANRATYFKGWNIFGAHMCGIFDLSLKAINSLLVYQDKRTGGFYVSKQGMESGKGLIDLNATSLVGLSCLVTGKVREATNAGDCVISILNQQPEFPVKFYSYLNPTDGQLLNSLPDSFRNLEKSDDIYAGKNSGQRSDIDRYHFCCDNDSDEIMPYAIFSMAFVFLCYLYMATGNPSYHDGAMKFFEFFDYACDKCWIKGQTTKVLWGLVLLYTFTEDKRVMEAIQKLCNHFHDTQVDGKGWVAPLVGGNFEDQPKWISIALTGDVLLGLGAVLRYF